MGSHIHCNCHTHNLVCDAQMARKLRLQNKFKLVDFCSCRISGIGNCAVNRELAKLAGGYKEPGGGVEV